MATVYPGAIDIFSVDPSGTSPLSTGPDHAADHVTLHGAIRALESKLGIGSGSAALNQIPVGSGAGTAQWGTVWNSANLGTPVVTGGTILGQVQNNGTVANGVYGTALHQGGTANNVTLGTPAITGGTITSPVIQTHDGWTGSTDTLVYASATSFTIAGVDRTTTYTVGTRVKFTNNSVTYYGTVASSSFSTNTTVNLIANTDYSINNSAITAPFYSYQANPQGYPSWFNWTLANNTFDGVAPTTLITTLARFSVVNKVCTIIVKLLYTNVGTSFSQWNFDGPVASAGPASKHHTIATGQCSGGDDTSPTGSSIVANSYVFGTTPVCYVKVSTGTTNAKTFWFSGSYQI